MPNIIQIFKSVRVIQKPDYTPETRKELGIWPESIDSGSGYIEDGQLYVSTSLEEDGIDHAELIILVDDVHPDQGFASDEEIRLLNFRQFNAPRPAEIFRIGKCTQGGFDIYLDYEHNSTTIGLPRRENHKIAELSPGKPVRCRINGKSDFTLSGRKQRTFHEFDYIIEFVGTAEKIKFVGPGTASKKKRILHDNCKLIDERKLLVN